MPEQPSSRRFGSFVTKLNPDGSAPIYSTFLGGETYDWATAIALDSAGRAYVTGFTGSSKFPVTAGAFQTSFKGGANYDSGGAPAGTDAFLAVVKPGGAGLVCATYLGGTGDEFGRRVVLGDEVYLAGTSASAAFPTTPGAFLTSNPNPGGYSDTLVKITRNCTTENYGTYVTAENNDNAFFGHPNDYGFIGLAVDSQGDAFIGSDTPSQTLAVTGDAAQSHYGGGAADGYLAEFDSTGSSLVYATYFGGTSDDGINALALGPQGNVYMTGATASATGFPLTPDAFQSTFGGTTGQAVDGHDAFVAALGTGTIGSIYPTSGGNAGSVTVTITGSNFEPGAIPSLVKGSTRIDGSLVSISPDGTRIGTVFDLTGAAVGTYSLAVQNPDNTVIGGATAFTVTEGGGPNVWVNIAGRSAIRVNTPTTFYVTVGNSGQADAYGVPLFIEVPSSVTLVPQFKLTNPPQVPNTPPIDYSQVPVSFTANDQTVAALFVPVIPAGSSHAIAFQITAPTLATNVEIQAYTTDALVSGALPQTQAPAKLCAGAVCDSGAISPDAIDAAASSSGGGICTADPNTEAACVEQLVQLILQLAGVKAKVSCVQQALSLILQTIYTGEGLYNIYSDPGVVTTGLELMNYQTIGLQIYNTVVTCAAGALPPFLQVLAQVQQIVASLENISFACGQVFQPCPPPPPPGQPSVVGAIDPNDKTGPQGALEGHWVLGSQPLSYTVSFENEPTAGASAQQVVITDQLDPTKFILKTVQLGPMGFGNTVVTPPAGSSNYSTTVDMGAVEDIADLKVNIQGSLDTSTGLLKWTFTSIDASTGLPVPQDDPAGFLPPNQPGVAPAGAGSVQFSVKPKHALANGTKVTNQASVVFDTNQPIETPIWHNKIAQPVAGALSISPRPLDFGNRPIFGSSGPMPVKAITLGNPSGVPILVGNLSTTSNFQIVNPQACQTLMKPGQSCTVRIKFVPDALGAYRGKLMVTDNSSSSPQTVALKGVGVPGTLSFTPAPLTFGKVKVNTTSAAKHLKMTNITGAVASVMSVVSSEPNSS